MIVIITCMDDKGIKIAQSLSRKLEIPFTYLDPDSSSNINDMNLDTMIKDSFYGNNLESKIILTNEMIKTNLNQSVMYICLYDGSQMTDHDNSWRVDYDYDLWLNISKMKQGACVEAIKQFVAIKMMENAKYHRG